jgi:CheY-like chemotaxis protein
MPEKDRQGATQLVRLVCWNDELAQQRSAEIARLGYRVDASSLRGTSAFVSHFRTVHPDAVVIDLDRLPSSGREVAIVLRGSKTTRHLPIVFAGGVEEKVARLRSELPDAVFTLWKKIGPALKRAMASPPIEPVRPVPHMERWNRSSLTQKLGIAAHMKVALIGGIEDGLEEIIGELPEGASLGPRIVDGTQLVLYVVHALRELDAAVDHAQSKLPEGASFWIIYPKTTATQRSDFNQNDVRALGLARGFVDYKVCSVDMRWSGLKFARRKR